MTNQRSILRCDKSDSQQPKAKYQYFFILNLRNVGAFM